MVDGRIDVDNQGPGFAITRFSGIVDTLLIGAAVPVDAVTSEVRFSFKTRNLGDAETTSTVGQAFVAEVCKQFEEDRPIWENKAHIVRPALADTDPAVHEVPQVVRPVLRRRRRRLAGRVGARCRPRATASRFIRPEAPPRPATGDEAAAPMTVSAPEAPTQAGPASAPLHRARASPRREARRRG